MDGRERFGWVRGEAVRGLGDGSGTGGGGGINLASLGQIELKRLN